MSRLVLAAAAAYAAYVGVLAFRRLDERRRQRAARWAAAAIGVVALVWVLSRFGLHWLGVVGAVVLAGLKVLLPLALRLLPLLHHLWSKKERGKPHAGSTDQPHAQAPARMSRKEALEILGVRDGASRTEILSAYRNLIRKVHPDSPGGSTYLATKLNQARDVLLR